MRKILLTCPPMIGLVQEFRPVIEARDATLFVPDFTQTMSEAELLDLVPDFDGWIIGDDPATAAVAKAGAAGHLRAAVKWGVGIDNVDFEGFGAANVPVTNTPGVFGREVADVALAYVLGLARETYRIDREIRSDNGWPKPAGISLWNKSAVIIGFGDIGKATARRLHAFDLEVSAIDPAYDVGSASDGTDIVSWPDGIADKDFVIATVPLNTATHHMINRKTLAVMKPGVRFINVSRGPVVDETALLEALESDHVHSAALEVFEEEPLPPASPLRAFPRCIFGSHNASNTADAVRHVSTLAIETLFNFLDNTEETRAT